MKGNFYTLACSAMISCALPAPRQPEHLSHPRRPPRQDGAVIITIIIIIIIIIIIMTPPPSSAFGNGTVQKQTKKTSKANNENIKRKNQNNENVRPPVAMTFAPGYGDP